MEKISHTFDALTGIETVTGLDPVTNRFVIKHRADIAPNIEHAKAIANDTERWSRGVKKGLALAGHIPAMTVIELKQIGIDVYTAPLKDIRAGLHKLGKEGFIWKS
jgi:hypothetical protein